MHTIYPLIWAYPYLTFWLIFWTVFLIATCIVKLLYFLNVWKHGWPKEELEWDNEDYTGEKKADP